MNGLKLKIESTSGKGNFQITKGSFPMLEIKYTSWFSGHAQTRFKGTAIDMKPGNFWQSKFSITKNDKEAGELKYHTRGSISFELWKDSEEHPVSYQFLSKGFWKPYYLLLDEAENTVLRLQPKWVWRKFSHDYEVEIPDTEYDEEYLTELLIYCGYATNVYDQKNAATTAAVT